MPGQKAFYLIARGKGSVRRLQCRGDNFPSLGCQRTGNASDSQITFDHGQNARVLVNQVLVFRYKTAGRIDDFYLGKSVECRADIGDLRACIKDNTDDSVTLCKPDAAILTGTVRLAVICPGL